MNTDELVEWQIIDPSNGLCFPWFAHPSLEEISKWDLKDKVVLEYGGGRSTGWWSDKCKEVYTIDTNSEWFSNIQANVIKDNVKLFFRGVNEGDQSNIDYYTEVPEGCKPDIVVVDGILRYECILKALTLPRPLTLIVDNWLQDYVFICPAAVELLKDFEQQIFPQPDHTNHEGNCWKTAIFYIK